MRSKAKLFHIFSNIVFILLRLSCGSSAATQILVQSILFLVKEMGVGRKRRNWRVTRTGSETVLGRLRSAFPEAK